MLQETIHSALAAATPPPAAPVLGIDGLIAIGAAFLSGVFLWIAGRHLVRPLYALVFAAAGGAAGFAAPSTMALEIGTLYPTVIGAIIGAVVGLFMFRLSMALALAIVLALGAPVGAGFYLKFNPTPAPIESAEPLTEDEMLLDGVPLKEDLAAEIDRLSEEMSWDGTISDLLGGSGGTIDGFQESLEHEAAEAVVEHAKAFIQAFAEEARAEWASLPDRDRMLLSFSTIAGALFGFMFGFWRPKQVAAATTAFLGAAVWIPAGMFLITTFGLPGTDALPTSPRLWLFIWLIVSLAGTVVQWTGLPRKADK